MPFASMTDADVEAFYHLLDGYFESRKELLAGWFGAGVAAAPAPTPSRASAARASPALGGRSMAPPPPMQAASHRPATPQSPALHNNDSGAPAAPASRTSSQPTNKYGITIPSMDDLKDPRFQSAFKLAGSSMAAAGGLLNKHVLSNPQFQGNHSNNNNVTQEAAPASVPAPPPQKASKPSTFAFSGARSAASPPPPPAMHAVSSNRGIGTCTAQFDYNSGEASDLVFREGDRIDIIAKESADWWKGSLHGREGLFPSSYVQED